MENSLLLSSFPNCVIKKIYPTVLHRPLTAVLLLVGLLTGVVFSSAAQAPAISYSSPQTYTAGTAITPLAPTSSGGAAYGYSSTPVSFFSGIFEPSGTAVDLSGNVYVTLPDNGIVYKFTTGGHTPVYESTGSPTGVAVDAAGNVYVADQNISVITKVPFSGGSYGTPVHLGSGFNKPSGIAVDAGGNIFVADFGNNAVKMIPLTGGTYGTPVSIGSGFNHPYCLALDASRNLFVGDSGNDAVKMIAFSGGAYSAPVATIASGFNGTGGVALDAAGNVYVGDIGNGAVKIIPFSGGTYGTPVSIGSGFNFSNGTATYAGGGVAADAAGNVYVGDFNDNVIKKITPVGGYFIGPFLPAGLNFNSNTGVISGTPVAISPATNYTVTAYNSSGSGTAALNITVVSHNPANDSLSSLVISSGTLSPAFASGTTSYTASINNSPTSITVTPTTSDPTATVQVNGTTVASGSASASLPLMVGPNTINTTVTAQDGTTQKTYTITVTLVLPAPAISYSSPQSYTVGTAIAPLSPTSSGVAAPGYSSNPVSIGSGFNRPSGVATDAAGNIYVADLGNNAVKEIPAGGGAPVTLGTGFSAPEGIAVDAAGNVYVADNGDAEVQKIPAGGGAPVTITSGFTITGEVLGVAVDAAGNVYVATNEEILKIPAGGGSPVTIGQGISIITSIAADAAGNVYVSAPSGVFTGATTSVLELPAAGGPPFAIATGINSTDDIRVGGIDATGNLYIIDRTADVVYQLPAGGGSKISIGSGFNLPAGVAADGAGNIYVTDGGNNTVEEIKPVGGYFISPQLPAGLSFNTVTGIISGTPTIASAATNYTVTAYNYGTGTPAVVSITVNLSAPVISYSSPQAFNKGTAITALAPVSSNVAALGYSSSTAALGSGFSGPTGVAVDAAGNIYVADEAGSSVKKIPAGGGSPIVLGSGFTSPTGIAVDRAGNVYVADEGNSTVKKIPAGGGSPVTLGSGFTSPTGVAIDTAGNIYVADEGNHAVKEIPVGGGGPVTIGSGFSSPTGVAVDPAGNVYVSDVGNNTVKELPVGGGAAVTLGSGFNNPFGISVDASGNIYVADKNNNAIEMIAAGGSMAGAIGSGFNLPFGVAVDGAGNVYVADFGNKAVEKIKPVGGYYINASLPAGLSFDNNTGIISGTPAAASLATNYTVTAYNAAGSGPATVNIKVVANNTDLKLLELSTNTTIVRIGGSSDVNFGSTVSPGTASITVTPTLADPKAIITVNGNPVTSGTPSGTITLTSNPTIINMLVTAQDGTTETYSLSVSKSGSNADALSFLTLSTNSQLVQVAGSSNVNYTTTVSPGTTSLTVTPTAYDPATESITVNGTAVTSGTASGAIALTGNPTVINLLVTAQNGNTRTYAIAVSESGSNDANLKLIELSTNTALTTVSSSASAVSFTTSVSPGTASLTVSPTTEDPNATVTVNGVLVASGTASAPITLSTDPETISLAVRAQNGTMRTYSISVTKAGSSDANLKMLSAYSNSAVSFEDFSTITPLTKVSSSAGSVSFSASVTYSTSLTVVPTTDDPNATVTVNGVSVISGRPSSPVALNEGANTILLVVTAQNGATRSYSISVARTGSSDAGLSNLSISSNTALSPSFATGTTSYTASVSNSISQVTVTPVSDDVNAIVVVNGYYVRSGFGFSSQPIPLSVGPNTVSVQVTAVDGTVNTYTVTITREMQGLSSFYEPISVTKPTDSVIMENDGIVVHQGLSPNGDGINDVFTIDGITNYPENQLLIINPKGQAVFEAKGYDNITRVFDGHSNIDGKMQVPGTYFYSLDYNVNGINKHKTGFIILKY